MNLLSGENSKLKRDGIYHFSIPAGKSQSGMLTCPAAGECLNGCYATQGFHGMSWVKNAKERRLSATFEQNFVENVFKEIRKRKIRRVRIHDSGDFYSKQYMIKWWEIARTMPDVHFYAYTKMISLFKGDEKPPKLPNLTIIFSYGGKLDHMIGPNDHHSKVFKTHEDMELAGYTDCTESDLAALNTKKVGLVYHGGKHKNWGQTHG